MEDKVSMKDDIEITTRSSTSFKTGFSRSFDVAISNFFLSKNIKDSTAEIIRKLIENYLMERQAEIYRMVDAEILANKEAISKIIEEEIHRTISRITKEIFDSKKEIGG
jgi:Tfp pilus assembly pilus retraction ATPase PilT